LNNRDDVRRGRRHFCWDAAAGCAPVTKKRNRTCTSSATVSVSAHGPSPIAYWSRSSGNDPSNATPFTSRFVVTGTVLGTRAPQALDQPSLLTQDGEDTPPTAEDLAHAAERLAAKDLDVSDDLLAELAAEYGVGGAVRVVAWSGGDEALMSEIRAMRDGDGTEGSVMGWGQIAKDLDVHPGIGSIMGQGGGHGRENAPGQQNRDDDDDAGG
jgi:hypothetical protein